MSRLFVFGDSYSTPNFCVDPADSFWGLAACDLKVNRVINYSWPGNNIDSIAHIIVSEIGTITNNDYVIIGVPPLCRQTVFANDNREYFYSTFDQDLNLIADNNTTDGRSIFFCHTFLDQRTTHELDKTTIMSWNQTWAEAQTFRLLLTLKAYLDSKNIKHIIVNLSKSFHERTNWPLLHSLQTQIESCNNIDILDSTYLSVNDGINVPVDFDEYGWLGHHGAAGNLRFYELIVRPLMQRVNWL